MCRNLINSGTFALMLVLAAACGKKKDQVAQPTPAGTAKFVMSVKMGTSVRDGIDNNGGGEGLISSSSCFQWMSITNGGTTTDVLEVHANASGAACPTTQLTDAAILTLTAEKKVEAANSPFAFLPAYRLKAKDSSGQLREVGEFQNNTSGNFSTLTALCQFGSNSDGSSYSDVCTVSNDQDAGSISGLYFN